MLQKISVLFSVDTSINRKNIKFISYHLILMFDASQYSKNLYKPPLKRRIILKTFKVVDIHMTSQKSFRLMQKSPHFLTNQAP